MVRRPHIWRREKFPPIVVLGGRDAAGEAQALSEKGNAGAARDGSVRERDDAFDEQLKSWLKKRTPWHSWQARLEYKMRFVVASAIGTAFMTAVLTALADTAGLPMLGVLVGSVVIAYISATILVPLVVERNLQIQLVPQAALYPARTPGSSRRLHAENQRAGQHEA
jgi:hypothetical protein